MRAWAFCALGVGLRHMGLGCGADRMQKRLESLGTSTISTSSDVRTSEIYGFMPYQDFAVTDVEYAARTGHAPQELRKKPFQAPFCTPDTMNNHHIIDLSELPLQTAGLRKARIFYRFGASHARCFLARACLGPLG